jgi:hypothetical protein
MLGPQSEVRDHVSVGQLSKERAVQILAVRWCGYVP